VAGVAFRPERQRRESAAPSELRPFLLTISRCEQAADNEGVSDDSAPENRLPSAPLLPTAIASFIWVVNCFLIYRHDLGCAQAESNCLLLGLAVATVLLAGAGEATLSALRTAKVWKATAWCLVGVLIQSAVVLVGYVVASAVHGCVGG
jgi:hypothetical protein